MSDSFFIESKERVRINTNDLKIGMYVSELDKPWLESSFLFQGFLLKTEADIKEVQKQCLFVYIDTTREVNVHRYSATRSAYTKDYLDNVKPADKRSSLKEELNAAGNVHRETSTLVKSFMEDVRLGRPINVMAAKQAVSNCVNSILNSPDALMLMTQLKNRDEYTAQHSMNVCIFSIALGRHIGLQEFELNNLGLSGMMHDMGKMYIPPEVLNKPGRLTPEEMEIMKSHTSRGWKLLINTHGIYPGAIDVAYMHHERLDGKGYPRGLTSEQITPFARIVAIVDMYDAVTSNRVYHNGRSHLDAIKVLNDSSTNGHLDPLLTVKFIECLGIYPAGSIVGLSTNETALVIEVNPKAKLKPRVLVIRDEHGKPCKEYQIDLSMTTRDASGQQYRITKILTSDECDIDLVIYYNSGLFQSILAAVVK